MKAVFTFSDKADSSVNMLADLSRLILCACGSVAVKEYLKNIDTGKNTNVHGHLYCSHELHVGFM